MDPAIKKISSKSLSLKLLKHDNCAAPVEGGRRGIQVQREEQVGHGLHNVSTWLEQNTELEHKKKEIIPFILKRTERKNNQTKENLGRKNRKQEHSNKRKLSTWAQKNRTQEQSSKRNFST